MGEDCPICGLLLDEDCKCDLRDVTIVKQEAKIEMLEDAIGGWRRVNGELETQLAEAHVKIPGGVDGDTNPRTRNARTIVHTTPLHPDASGFYWHCLDCKAMNEAETSPMDVTCTGCRRKYRLEPVSEEILGDEEGE